MATSADSPRWAQLTYASFDPGNGIGGWQVKQSRGDLTPAELREISAHLVTAFDSHVAMPEYPTPEDIAAQPRRCAHLLAYSGRGIGAGGGPLESVTSGCTLHAVQAGSDSTGRPGNVFSHAVLDRRPAHVEPRVRPIELWRSFDLLTPYGTQEVLAATLHAGEYPRPSGLVGRDLVLDFIFDPATWRMGVLSVLLDAVSEAMHGGRRVALVTAGPDQAAMWIAAVSWCMAPSTARRFSWSVYERASRLRDAFDRGVHLVGVPRDDASAINVDDGDVIVLDDLEMPRLGQLDVAPHVTRAGQEVRPTPWSLLAQESLVDAPTASGVLALLDDIADRAGESPLAPAWPLAMAHLVSAPDDVDTSAAARVAVAQAPAADLDAWLGEVLERAALASIGDGPEGAWQAVATASGGSRVAHRLVGEYLRRALGDAAWLTRDGGVPLPSADLSATVDDRVREAFDAALEATDPEVLLRAVDLGARLGLVGDGAGQGQGERNGEARARAVSALATHVAAGMLRGTRDDDGDGDADAAGGSEGDAGSAGCLAYLDRVGLLDPIVHLELAPAALRRVIAAESDREAAAVADAPGAPSSNAPRIDDAALAWIARRGLPPSPDEAPGDTAADPVGDALLEWVTANRMHESGTGYAVVDRLLRRYGSWYAIPAELRRVEPVNLWRLNELIALEGDFPGSLPAKFLEPHLACSSSPEIVHLAHLIERRDATHEARVAAFRLDAEGAESRVALAGHERLELAVALWTTYGAHVEIQTFAPSVLEAAVLGASETLTGAAWPRDLFPVLAACVARHDSAPRTVQRLIDRLLGASDDARHAGVARIMALDLATQPGASDRFAPALTPQAREVGALVDPGGARLIEIIAGAVCTHVEPVMTDAPVTTIARHLAEIEGDASERRVEELERYVRQRRDPRRGGDARFRPFRARQSKEH